MVGTSWYDDYDFNSDGAPGESFEAHPELAGLTGNNRSPHQADTVRTDGLVTGSRTRVLQPQQLFESDNGVYGQGHATDADEVYYIGTSSNYRITLKPGFQTKPGQKVVIGGPLVQVPSDIYDSNGSWTGGVSFYDKYGRTIYAQSTNHLGGTDKSWTLYHFDGEVERTIQIHQSPYDTVTTNGKAAVNEYDGNSRLITTTSPEGRQAVSHTDSLGRVIHIEVR